MAYEVEIDGLVLPIPPSKIDTKIKGNNKTINLINDGDVNVLKFPGLTEFSLDARLSYNKYPFSLNDLKPDVFLNKFEELMVSKKPCQFIIKRPTYKGDAMHFKTDKKVSLEDYTIKEDAKDGMDIVVTLKFKLFRDYGTKIVKIIEEATEDETTVAVVENQRNADSAPELKTYTVAKGDCLWNIAKQYLGDGSRYMEIYELNKDILKNPNKIYPGQVLKMPDVKVTASAKKTTTKKTTSKNTTKTTTAKTETTPTTSTTISAAKNIKVKLNVQMKGKIGFTECCHVVYYADKIKTARIFQSSFSLNVDANTEVILTFKHLVSKNNPKAINMYATTNPEIWKQEKEKTFLKLTKILKSTCTVTARWQ